MTLIRCSYLKSDLTLCTKPAVAWNLAEPTINAHVPACEIHANSPVPITVNQATNLVPKWPV